MGEFFISTGAADFWLEDGTLKARATRAEITLDNARESFEALSEALSGNGSDNGNNGVKRALIDMGKGNVVNRQTRGYLAETSRLLNIDKAALVFNNPVQRIAASFFLGINKPAGDLRLFGNVREAEEWLKA